MRKLLLNPTPLFRKLRQLSLLLTLLLAFPLSIWGEEVTKTFTFNKQVDAVTTGINNSSMSVSITEQVTGGSSTSTDGTVNILDGYDLLSSYSCTTNSGAVFTLKEIADEDKYFTIEIPGTYPSTPTQVTLTVAYNNSGTNANTENAKIMVGDYGLGAQASTQPQSTDPVTDLYNYYHPYRSNATSMTETTLTYTANNTSGLGTNRDTEKSLVIAVFLNGSASFTIKEATITYNRNPLDINWKLGGSVVTNASVTFGENYSLPQLDVSDGYIGTITYESNNSTVAIVGASGDVTPLTSGETVITATAPATNTFEGGTASYTLTVNKATPTMTFSKRQQTGDNNPGDITSIPVADNETLTTTCGSTFYAPAPTFSNGHALSDSTRFVYSYSVDGVVVFPNNGENTNNPGKINYGEISLLKAGTVTITCTFPGNMQNNSCSASYTLQVDKGNATFEYQVGTTAVTTSDGYIDVNGVGQWGDPNTGGGSAPALTIPSGATAITYTSSDTNVATVTTTGTVTPVGPGQTTITATMKDDDCYNNATASYELTVKVPATISFANATASVLNTATYTQAATTDPAGSTITYSSSNNDVNVDANGQVTISNQSFYGPVTITATLTAVPAANPQYYYVQSNNAAFQATYTLNVAKEFNYVNFASGQSYATCILSEQLTKPDGLKVYYITGTNGNTVTTQEIDYLPYGIPILLEKTAATIGSVTARTDSSSVVSGNLLQYATSDVSATGNQYVLYKNEFVKATGTINRACYLDLNGVAPARGMYGIGNDGSTAIEGIDVEATKDEEWYDLQGRRIQKPTKAGIYIVNGKKMIINNK